MCQGGSSSASDILDGIEAGREDIYPDPFAVDFGQRYESSPKAVERGFAEMFAQVQNQV